jgi:hypothetical protein
LPFNGFLADRKLSGYLLQGLHPLAETAIFSVALDAATLNRADPPKGIIRPGPYRSFMILSERIKNLGST